MRDYHFAPESYLALMREAVPGYDRLEDETLAATGVGARSVLELGTGTGETARRVLDRHPGAKLIGIDASPGMVNVARGENAAAIEDHLRAARHARNAGDWTQEAESLQGVILALLY